MERLTDQSSITIERPTQVIIQQAKPEDEASIQRLLEQQAMGGEVRIRLCREPQMRWAMDVEGDRHTLVIGRQQTTGRIVATGCRSVRNRWVNGQKKKIGYMGLLRRDPSLVGHVRLLRDGWKLCHDARQADEESFDLTSIVSDNLPARRLLERGIRNLPTYQWHADLESLLFRTHSLTGKPGQRDKLRFCRGFSKMMPMIVAFLNEQHRQYQFSPCWTQESLQSHTRARDLQPEDFLLALHNDKIVGMMAVWDQRRYKQTVIDGYANRIARWRPLMNLAAELAGRPAFPSPGHILNMAFISHWAVRDHDPAVLQQLIRHASGLAKTKGIDLLLMTVAHDHPNHSHIKRIIKGVSYQSRLYVVHRGNMPTLDHRPTYVEAALL